MHMPRFTIQLAPTQAAALTAMAARHEHSVAAEIRAAVASHLDAAAAT
jgi:plasmid stability protein